MNLPIREKGLQINALLSLGNSLYSVLMAGIAAVIVHSLSDGLSLKDGLPSFTWGSEFWGLRAVFLLVTIYFFFDWYDLNQVTYADKKLGRLQVFLWVLSVCTLSVAIFFSLTLGILTVSVLVVSVLAFAYVPFTVLIRDELITYDDGKSSKQNFNRGKLATLILIFAAIVFAVLIRHCIVQARGDAGYPEWMLRLAVGVWAGGLAHKIFRSFKKLAGRYEAAIQEIIEASS